MSIFAGLFARLTRGLFYLPPLSRDPLQDRDSKLFTSDGGTVHQCDQAKPARFSSSSFGCYGQRHQLRSSPPLESSAPSLSRLGTWSGQPCTDVGSLFTYR